MPGKDRTIKPGAFPPRAASGTSPRASLPNDRVKDQTGPRINGFITVRMTHSSRENLGEPILPRKHGGGRFLVKTGTGHDRLFAGSKHCYLVGSLRLALPSVKPFCVPGCVSGQFILRLFVPTGYITRTFRIA